MNKKLTCLLALCTGALFGLKAFAQKTMWIPYEWRNRTDTLIWAEEDPENKYTWSKSRSKETDNVIILWDKGWGKTSPSNTGGFYNVDIEDLAQKVESFYQLECDKLGFVDPENSNLKKYKVMVLMNHTDTWTCYGGGYDYQVPALWLNPATCKPVGSAVAHEVGHSFHYMCYAEDSKQGSDRTIQTGFHSAVGQGQCIWETTANWQALQSYPNELFTESYHHVVFNNTHNMAFSHEWHRYQAYMFLYYLNHVYGDIKTVANVWNHRVTSVMDFNQALMSLKGLNAAELYRLHFDFALHAVTWDLDVWKEGRNNYIGNFEYFCVKTGKQRYQVAYASAPQGTGFNVIPLQVPAAGKEVKVVLTGLPSKSALAVGDPGLYNNSDQWLSIDQDHYNYNSNSRSFNAGFVILKTNGEREYVTYDKRFCQGKGLKSDTLSMTVPTGASKMWMVVAPSPGSYIQHKWNEKMEDDDQWPYRFELIGTDLTDKATVYDSYQMGDRTIGDVTIRYDMYALSTTGANQEVVLGTEALIALGTALQMDPKDIADKIEPYSKEGPTPGHIMLYPYAATEELIDTTYTANEPYGYWYTQFGALSSEGAGNARVKAVFNPAKLSIKVTSEANAMAVGRAPALRMALRYKREDGREAIARLLVVLHMDRTRETYSFTSTTYDEDKATGINSANTNTGRGETYDLQGRKVNAATAKGILIQNGRKVIK